MCCSVQRGPCGARRWFLVRLAMLGVIVGCSSLDDPPGDAQCLPYPQVKKRCDVAFKACLNSPIQDIRSETFGHSMCSVCKDVCTRMNGVWPDEVDGRPCK
ncbi:hypothetical protein [Myxococcus sp. RHSTA-1-4]|uniref:hypothetical protein n=1 Tax=Myxococcus sp. RHSTA-1-4 TaxID=2874601 RepID=UPI001CBE2F33|nr:hypothetical protein [Myxococcus sp. RHSTA-1-4]MBZ4417006.1 hypothetical protein [Myxococcus sp. RHSTA-1-4]